MKRQTMFVKTGCHSRGMLSGIYNACRYLKKGKTLLNKCVEDPRYQPSGMTPNLIPLTRPSATLSLQGRGGTAHGFTLIELLVVVLIIGILAAVAVPQYQKAVEKARLAQVLPLATALYKAEKTYFLANGEHTADLSLLDMEVPSCELKNNYYDCNSFWVGVWGPTHAQIVLLDSSNSFQLAYLHFFADNEEDNAREGDIFCYSNGEIYRKVCQSLGTGTEKTSNHKAWNYAYVLSK